MSTHLKFCGCRSCRDCMHGRRNGRNLIVKAASRKARRTWNSLARQQRDEEIGPVSVPYIA